MKKNLVLIILVLFIFFGFIVYNIGNLLGFFDVLPTGWLFISSAISLPILLLFKNEYNYKQSYLKSSDFYFKFYLVIFIIVLLSAYCNGKNEMIILGNVSNIIVIYVFYLIGKNFPEVFSGIINKLLLIFYAFATIFILLNRSTIINFWDFVDVSLNYQGLGLSYFVLTLINFPNFKRTFRLPIYFVSIFVLSILGARSEIIGLCFAIVIYEFFYLKLELRFILTLSFILLIILLPSIIGFLAEVTGQQKLNGIINYSKDDSFTNREFYNNMGYKTIQENSLLGDYASYESGEYIHNVLSAWVDVGFFGFFSIILAMLFSVKNLIKLTLNHKGSFLFMILAFNISVFIVSIFSKYHMYPLIGLALGMKSMIFAYYNNQLKENNNV